MSLCLQDWLGRQPKALAATIEAIVGACEHIADTLALGALADTSAVCADACITAALGECPHVAAWAGGPGVCPTASDDHGQHGEFLVVFDPPDASSRIESNTCLGTIFSVLPHPFRGTPPGEAGFLQPGSRQLAAGYVIYGPATVLMLGCGTGVAAFTLDRRSREWRCTRSDVRLPTRTREFAINVSNQRFWEKPVQRYVAECLSGESGPRASDFDMRWLANVIAEAHHIFDRGGVFMSPRDSREPHRPGHLRLLHEAAPIAWLIEQAGGLAVTGTQGLLDIVPDTLQQHVPAIFGSRDEVALIVAYHAQPQENVNMPLFKTRSLFIQPQT